MGIKLLQEEEHLKYGALILIKTKLRQSGCNTEFDFYE